MEPNSQITRMFRQSSDFKLNDMVKIKVEHSWQRQSKTDMIQLTTLVSNYKENMHEFSF